MGLNIGANPISDMYVGGSACDRVYKGSDLLFDANSEVQGLSPIYFQSRAKATLKNYRVYGVSGGAGVQTENLFDKGAKDVNNGYVYNKYLQNDGTLANGSYYYVSEYISVQPNEQYTVSGTGGFNTPSICYYGANYDYLSGVEYSGRTKITTTAPNDAAYVRLSVGPNREDVMMFTPGSTDPASYIPPGYQIPLTVTSGAQSQDYPLYIGATKLGEEEYLDYGEQKVYKNVSGTLTPIEPPFSFPAITISKGNNKISSSTEVGKIYVKGRINNQPLGYVMTQITYDVLSPQQKYGNKYFAIYNSGTTGNVESVYNLTQTEYDALTEYDVTGLYIIETSGTISNAYVGANQLDALYLGGTKIWNTSEYELPDWFPRIDVESIFAHYQSYSQYYYDFCCQKINTTDGTYAYVRIYCENASDGEIGLLDNSGVDTYFTWYTANSGHRIVAYRFGGEYQPTFSQGHWTDNREYASNYIGGSSKQTYSPKPCVIKKTMTRVNFVGAITPDKIGF